jgi:hypothetical protein
MLKREKEVFAKLLTDEEAVIKDLERSFQRALQDIETKIKILQADEMTQSKIYQIQYQRALKAQIEGIVEKLHGDNFTSIQQYLNECYTSAFVGTMYALHGQGMPVLASIDQDAAVRAVMTDSKINEGLYEALGVDAKALKKSIQREISVGLSSGATYAEITRNISFATGAPLSRAKTIVRTEGHRVQQASSADARNAAKAQGCSVVKQWDSTLDGKTRDTHRELDGQIRETDKPFESSSGRKARYPGDFGDPAEDCNCRCVALTRATWDLDADELKTLKERAAFFGLDKTGSFADFEKKYLKAAQTVEKSGKSGIIEAGNLAIPMQKLVGYALDPQKAPDKAKAFELALGYTKDNAAELLQSIFDNADESRFVEKGDSGFGMRYEYIMELEGPNGKKARVVTAWIRENGKLRLTSVYVTGRKVTE